MYKRQVPARVAIGFGLLFLAFLTIVSLFTPGADVDPNCLFIQVLSLIHIYLSSLRVLNIFESFKSYSCD